MTTASKKETIDSIQTPALTPDKSSNSNNTENQKITDRLAGLVAQRDQLVVRLDTGAAAIEEARAQGKNVESWENFWLELLRSYEGVCDQIKLIYLDYPQIHIPNEK